MKILSLETMIVGRFIFGIGGESINITISMIIVNWFKGSELSFAQVSLFLVKNIMKHEIGGNNCLI